MNKLLKVLAFLAMAWPCLAQGVRYENTVTTAANNTPYGAAAPVMTVPFAMVQVCGSPMVGTPCTNKVSIYGDQALTVPLDNPLKTDAHGHFGFWIAPGNYIYSVSSPAFNLSANYNFSAGSVGASLPSTPSVVFSTSSTSSRPATATDVAGLWTSCGSQFMKGDGTCATPSGGSINAAPQYRLFLQPTAGTQAVAGPASQGFNGVAAMLQGKLNTDLYANGGGNNGIANALSSADCGGACTVEVPPTSTDTENPFFLTVTASHVRDLRGQSIGDFFWNPAVDGGAGHGFNGEAFSAAKAIVANWSQSSMLPGNYHGQTQTALDLTTNFNSPGWNWGTWGGPYPGSLWSTQHGINVHQTVETQGIASPFTLTQDKYAVGDSQAAYLYTTSDGGCNSGGDECSTGFGVHDDQHSTWFHGTVAAGATTGTQLLPVTYTPGTNSRSQVSVGGIMLDTNQNPLTAYVNGPAVQVPGYAAWATPITGGTATVSGAWGLAQAAIPTPVVAGTAQTDTVTFSVAGGTNAGGFTTGTACLDGAAKYEQVAITAVGTLSGGLQSVTFTHRYPNVQTGTSLWQGGLCGTYYVGVAAYNLNVNGLTGWRTAYPVFGARSANEIVGRFLTNATVTAATSIPIPNLWTTQTANVALTNLTVSGTTVTASMPSGNASKAFDGLASAVISNASNSAFNGTVSNVVLSNNNQTISWTQSGVSGTSATANISYPQNYFGFFLYKGAAVVQPQTIAGVPLEPNSVFWAEGAHLENVFDPAYGGYNIAAGQIINSPASAAINNIGGINYYGQGAGISGQYHAFTFQNLNPNSLYVGGGGWLTAPSMFRIKGPMSTTFLVDQAPIDGSAFFDLGCAISTQGGCGNANADLHIIAIDSDTGHFDYTTQTQEFYLNKLRTARVRGNILSTGDGHLVNGNFAGVPVALTAASAIRGNLQPGLGTYGAFGNEGILDTSATIAAKSFYAGTLYAGAASPTVTSVVPQGTTGSSTWSYVATSVTQNGESLPSATVTITNGNATLSSSNNNNITLLLGYGAQSTKVYRTAAPAGYATGLICSVANNMISGNGTVPACDDTGQAATGSVPAADTTGKIVLGSAADGCATFASGSLGSTGTPCGSGGGGNTTSTSLTTNTLPKANGPNSIINSALSDDGTTVISTEPIQAPSFSVTGTTPASISFQAGTGSIPALPANSAGLAAPATGGTAYLIKLPATITAGIPHLAAPATGDGVNESVMTSGPVTNADLANSSTTVNGVTCTLGSTCTVSTASSYPWSCQPGLGDGLNAITAGTYLQTSCYNDTGQTVTLTGIKCYADAGTPTMNVTNSAGTGLLTGAVTCSSAFASGTQSGTTTIAAGDYLKFTFVASGTAKQATFVVTGTHP